MTDGLVSEIPYVTWLGIGQKAIFIAKDKKIKPKVSFILQTEVIKRIKDNLMSNKFFKLS